MVVSWKGSSNPCRRGYTCEKNKNCIWIILVYMKKNRKQTMSSQAASMILQRINAYKISPYGELIVGFCCYKPFCCLFWCLNVGLAPFLVLSCIPHVISDHVFIYVIFILSSDLFYIPLQHFILLKGRLYLIVMFTITFQDLEHFHVFLGLNMLTFEVF